VDSPETQIVRKLEGSLILPDSAMPIQNYNRTYAISATKIEGVLIATTKNGTIKIVPLSSLHMQMRDGGCGGIQVTYDRTIKRWTKVVCNGSA
jgi:hypothetical protein